MTTSPREILMTTALPYANGAIHLGHMLEYIQADIWARFQNLKGNHCLYVCGEDTHGTPIMISAEKQGITPEELIARSAQAHQADFKDFLIHCDSYYTTHSTENQQLANVIYERLKARGDIETREIVQAYDPVKSLFLPDRYVKGECPRCGAADQYGDNCEVCGATYAPTELRNPISTLSGVPPIQKSSVHYFFGLDHYAELLKNWTHAGHLQDQVANKLSEWFTEGLQAWDISRDAPYFGFEIPDAKGKYFYVWLDAPVGYMASFQKLCELRPELKFETYWGTESKTELYHFIGKDIIYFHALFWPAMLSGSGFRLPSAIFAHGFLTINGQKMSKSRGTFITARDYLEYLDPEYLRYYFAAKLSSRVEDIDLNFTDFIQRVNSDLIGKVVNIASRCAGFINKHFDHRLSESLSEMNLYQEFVAAGDSIAQWYETREYQHAMREIMQLADKANQYIDGIKPWVLAKQAEHMPMVQSCCTMGLNLFKLLIAYLKPVLPELAKESETFLRCEPLNWANRETPLINRSIGIFQPLMQRIDPAKVEALRNKDNHSVPS